MRDQLLGILKFCQNLSLAGHIFEQATACLKLEGDELLGTFDRFEADGVDQIEHEVLCGQGGVRRGFHGITLG